MHGSSPELRDGRAQRRLRPWPGAYGHVRSQLQPIAAPRCRQRGAGMLGQQLARFASRRLRQNHERLQLTQMLRDVLLQRGRETQARGVQLKQVLQPVEVLADASLLFSLLNTVLDWALAC